MNSAEKVMIESSGGGYLAATVTLPPGDPEAVLLVCPALGVRADYYTPFCELIAETGVAVVVADMRGQGDSAPRSRPDHPTRIPPSRLPGLALAGRLDERALWARSTPIPAGPQHRWADLPPLQCAGQERGRWTGTGCLRIGGLSRFQRTSTAQSPTGYSVHCRCCNASGLLAGTPSGVHAADSPHV